MELTCEQLGITPDDIADRVSGKIADRMLAQIVPDYDDETGAQLETERPTAFQEMVRKRVARKVEAAVDAVAEKVLGEGLEMKLTALRFPQTNGYGEPKSEPLTMMEFIARRVDTYLSEQVDNDGRPGRDGYGSARNPRAVWMLEKYLSKHMADELNKAVKVANEKIVNGIAKTVEANLADITRRLKVEVKV